MNRLLSASRQSPAGSILWMMTLVGALLFALVPSMACAQATPPQQHERWIGTWEEESGKGEVYDFRFRPSGSLEVIHSTGTQESRQQFSWVAEGNDILVSGDAQGPVGEVAQSRLALADAQHYVLKLPGQRAINVRRSITALSWLHAVLLFAFLFGANEVCRRVKLAPYIVFFVLPIVLIPVFMTSGFDSVFRWVKMYSAVVGAIFFTLVRFHGLDKHQWARFVVAFILGFNILEACTQDFSSGHLANYLNAFAGVLNTITISRWAGIRRDSEPPHDMLWPGMTVGWILAYDIWNFTFVYLNFPNTALFTLVLVTAPTLAAMFVKKGTWMQARAYTLAIYMMYIFSLKHFAEHSLNLQFSVPLPRSESIALGLAVVSVTANLAYAALHFRWRFTGTAPSRVQVGQNESVI